MDIPDASSAIPSSEPPYTPSASELISKAISEQIRPGHSTCIVNLESQLDPDLIVELERKGYVLNYIYQYSTSKSVVANRVMITNPNLTNTDTGSVRIEEHLRFSGIDTSGLNIGKFLESFFR